MDTISFTRSPLELPRTDGIAVHPRLASPAAGLYRVRVEVDDVPLVELIRTIELPLATAEGHPQIAGDYVEPVFGWPDDQPPGAHYLGVPGSDWACWPAGKTVLLGDADEFGAWPLMARIDVGPRVVTWSAFEQPYRPHWDYGLRLVFDRDAYEDALDALRR
ncbi:MAG: hypothetical protein R3C15_03365 [Thermoleophilia bacterium]